MEQNIENCDTLPSVGLFSKLIKFDDPQYYKSG